MSDGKVNGLGFETIDDAAVEVGIGTVDTSDLLDGEAIDVLVELVSGTTVDELMSVEIDSETEVADEVVSIKTEDGTGGRTEDVAGGGGGAATEEATGGTTEDVAGAGGGATIEAAEIGSGEADSK